MKYKIGQILYPGWVDTDDFDEEWHKCEIVCIALFGDFTWKYGIKDKDSEYSDQVDFVSEYEIINEYILLEEEKNE